ncbi:MAG: patatin-like phospholipase family protein [Myxococcales bacterium]|nr:patatin-like phospholipase family protein [Myxococcales bacterium]
MTMNVPSESIARPTRRALVLCGGGATGAAYEVGVLAGLEASIPGFRVTDFDIYIGTSAGAMVATFVAAGVSVTRFFNSLVTGDDFFPLRRSDVYGFDTRETLTKLGHIARFFVKAAHNAKRDPKGFASDVDLGDLSRTLPDGLFSLRAYQRFIERFLSRQELPRYFEQIPKQLLIPANNLDTAHREVFGLGYRLDASLSQAIIASSAIPLFFNPVRIGDSDLVDGGSGKVAHVDLAQAAGATHALVINPIVPWNLARRLTQMSQDGEEPGELVRIRQRGMWGVWNQSFRISTISRLNMGLRRFEAEHPDVGLALISPSELDETLFVTNPMNTEARAVVAQRAFDSTLSRMRSAEGAAIAAVCLGQPMPNSHIAVRAPDERWIG